MSNQFGGRKGRKGRKGNAFSWGLALAVAACLFIYYLPFDFGVVTQKYMDEPASSVKGIEAYKTFGPYRTERYALSSPEQVSGFLEYMGNIKVRRCLFPLSSFRMAGEYPYVIDIRIDNFTKVDFSLSIGGGGNGLYCLVDGRTYRVISSVALDKYIGFDEYLTSPIAIY